MTHLSALALTRPGDTREGDRAERWQSRAECLGVDPEIFFPTVGPGSRSEERTAWAWSVARSYCARCPVRDLCLDDALAVETPSGRYGMYGGTTPEERQAIYRQRGRTKTTTRTEVAP